MERSSGGLKSIVPAAKVSTLPRPLTMVASATLFIVTSFHFLLGYKMHEMCCMLYNLFIDMMFKSSWVGFTFDVKILIIYWRGKKGVSAYHYNQC